ncbi:hypothetical protein SAMN05216243_1185 [Sediminibacillus albus]|uniref:Uncharacterized protein n=1 Tax=Sediminibacillus albus TaxID=407036 RepID=A0A1G8X6R1_9BACI|nr:hypothetical protein SAMN05216243_1185 [Sediminibacillus albus]
MLYNLLNEILIEPIKRLGIVAFSLVAGFVLAGWALSTVINYDVSNFMSFLNTTP